MKILFKTAMIFDAICACSLICNRKNYNNNPAQNEFLNILKERTGTIFQEDVPSYSAMCGIVASYIADPSCVDLDDLYLMFRSVFDVDNVIRSKVKNEFKQSYIFPILDMNYVEVQTEINRYKNAYDAGMKADADAVMKALCERTEALPQCEREGIYSALLRDICDSGLLGFLADRGDGSISFFLKNALTRWLLPRCEAGQMPEMRWFYQINRNDGRQCENAHLFLRRAFESEAADRRTYELIFEQNVRALEYGLHELPTGLLMSDEEYHELVSQCEQIASKINVPESLSAMLCDCRKKYAQYRGATD